jgi:hypothetical protein
MKWALSDTIEHGKNRFAINRIEAEASGVLGFKTHEAMNNSMTKRLTDAAPVKRKIGETAEDFAKRRESTAINWENKRNRIKDLFRDSSNESYQLYRGRWDVSAKDRVRLDREAGARNPEYKEWVRESARRGRLSESDRRLLNQVNPQPEAPRKFIPGPNSFSSRSTGMQEFGTTKETYWSTTKSQWGKRAAGLANAGNPKIFATDVLNMMGLQTKHQRTAMRASGSLFAKAAALAGHIYGAYSFHSLTEDGESSASAAWSSFITPAVGIGGFRVGKAATKALITPSGLNAAQLTQRAAGMTRFGRGASIAATWAGGIGVGLAGYMAAETIGAIPGQLMDGNSLSRRTARSFIPNVQGATSDNDQTLTHRQRALMKLSKSGLNDRSMLMGNEAAILAGVY